MYSIAYIGSRQHIILKLSRGKWSGRTALIKENTKGVFSLYRLRSSSRCENRKWCPIITRKTKKSDELFYARTDYFIRSPIQAKLSQINVKILYTYQQYVYTYLLRIHRANIFYTHSRLLAYSYRHKPIKPSSFLFHMCVLLVYVFYIQFPFHWP